MTTYQTKDGDTLDWICWKHYSQQSGAVERVLEANPLLADQPVSLPAGLILVLPDLPAPEAEEVVRFWS